MKTPRITVIGSINMDLVTVAENMPEQGETISGDSFKTLPGGKGANQAVAAARLGAEVHMIGKVGDDPFGATLFDNFEAQGVNTGAIEKEVGISSGLANIIVSNHDNRIIIIAGANGEVTPDYVDGFKGQIEESDYVLIQFEIRKRTIEHILDFCKTLGVPVIINQRRLPCSWMIYIGKRPHTSHQMIMKRRSCLHMIQTACRNSMTG